MSPLTLTIFTILIFSTCGTGIASNATCGTDSLSNGNNNDNDNSTTITDDRTVKRPIFGTTTTESSPTVFQPTPTDSNLPMETTILPLEQQISITFPTNVVLPPPASTNEPQEPVTICGKMGNCYRWFDDQWALELNGYKRCEPRDERRAMRYCCIPPSKSAF